MLVNGAADVLSTADGQPMSLTSFAVTAGKIVAFDIIAGPDRP